ncbi:hypothetical protein [Thiocapsa bogorovii]|uniref:hypothetical protein n=1 Tax=Thiocapsa bogorovii TaxID=521689 RepID=UPI001E3E70BF|nr:hypothetical protein [Thiocapsa bogorovii]UHD15698.1 hypothetical protein LT988_20950 [Thiocapsa bogorovii]
MYIDIVPNRTSRPAILLRESIREGTRIIKRTTVCENSLAPIPTLPDDGCAGIRVP